MTSINVDRLPLHLEFIPLMNCYLIRDKDNYVIESFDDDSDAEKYLMTALGIDSAVSKNIISTVFLAGISKPMEDIL